MNDLLKNKRLLLIAGIVVVLIIAILLVVIATGDEDRPSPDDNQVSENENVDPEKYPGMTEAEIKELRGAPDELTEAHKLNRTKILKREAEDYRWRAQFPDASFPINRNYDPVKNEFTPAQPMTTHPDFPNGPFLVQYLDKISHAPDEPLVIHAFLLDGEKQKMKTNDLQAVLTVGGAAGRILGTISMSDNGGTGDTRDDLVYTAAFTLPGELARPDAPPANFTVIVSYKDIQATNAFSVGSINIRHTGSYSDRLHTDEKGGHLMIEAEFDVQKEGFYHVQGSVYGLDGEAIGMAQNRVKLEPGKQKVPLIFYGKLFCDKKASGPYVLQNMAYQNVARMPGVRSEPVKPGYQTAAYPATQFTCASFEHPDYMARAAQAEQDAAEEKFSGDGNMPRAN